MAADTTQLATQANLARQERSAALRALAGRLAHQMRNPLAAIRAACGSLQAEIEDPDQRETLELTVREVDRMLTLVSATVQTVAGHAEKPRATALFFELRDVIGIVDRAHGDSGIIDLIDADEMECTLPREGFRVAVFSLLDHILSTLKPGQISVRAGTRGAHAMLEFEAADTQVHSTSPIDSGLLAAGGSGIAVGLLVTERFARDIGGRLSHSAVEHNCHIYLLDLPCANA